MRERVRVRVKVRVSKREGEGESEGESQSESKGESKGDGDGDGRGTTYRHKKHIYFMETSPRDLEQLRWLFLVAYHVCSASVLTADVHDVIEQCMHLAAKGFTFHSDFARTIVPKCGVLTHTHACAGSGNCRWDIW